LLLNFGRANPLGEPRLVGDASPYQSSKAKGDWYYVVKPVDFQAFMNAIEQVGAFWALYNEPPPGCLRIKR
jgi:hypothetical protein